MAGYCRHGNEPYSSMKYDFSGPAEEVLGSQDGLCSMELVVLFPEEEVCSN